MDRQQGIFKSLFFTVAIAFFNKINAKENSGTEANAKRYQEKEVKQAIEEVEGKEKDE